MNVTRAPGGGVRVLNMSTRAFVVAVLVLVAAVALGGAGGAASTPIPVRVARQARVELRIFPSHLATVACRIPRGGPAPGGRIAGRCSTALAGTPGHGGASIVTFTERWGSGRRFHHTWRVRVTATNSIVWIRESGDEAPQTWR